MWYSIFRKWYWNWQIPKLEEELDHIINDINFLSGQQKTKPNMKDALKLRSLRVAKEYLTHKIDYNSGWTF